MDYILKKDELEKISRKLDEEEFNQPKWINRFLNPQQKEEPIFDNIIKLVIEKLDDGARSVLILEKDIKSILSGFLFDELHLLGRFRKRLKGTGLSVVTINDIKINGGKRTYRVYNTKLRLGIVDMEK